MLDIVQICVAKLIKIEGRSIGAENEERADITVVSGQYELWAALWVPEDYRNPEPWFSTAVEQWVSEGKCVSPIMGLETRSWALQDGELGLIKTLQKPGVLKIDQSRS